MTLKIGHRGAKAHVLENTIESFKKAFELQADGIELDIHLSKDGHSVVIHDDTIDRTIKGKTGIVNEILVEECKKMGIPTLEDVFEILLPNSFLNIEIKDKNAVLDVVNQIEKRIEQGKLMYKNILISSFNWSVLQRIAKINPLLQTGVLTENNFEEALEFCNKIQAYSINAWYKLLTKEKVQLAQSQKLKVYTFTVNSVEDIIFVKNLGVDAIISDYPERL